MRLLLAALLLSASQEASAGHISGNASIESRLFTHRPAHAGQRWNAMSASIEPEFHHAFTEGKSLTIRPFLRLDTRDERRTHVDLREFSFVWNGDGWELRAGVDKVFWGVTESVHLVDIIRRYRLFLVWAS